MSDDFCRIKQVGKDLPRSFLNNFKGVFKMIKREMKKYKPYVFFSDNDKMSLTDKEGVEVIIEAVDEFQAYCKARQLVLDNSRYSEEETLNWLNSHSIRCEKIS